MKKLLSPMFLVLEFWTVLCTPKHDSGELDGAAELLNLFPVSFKQDAQIICMFDRVYSFAYSNYWYFSLFPVVCLFRTEKKSHFRVVRHVWGVCGRNVGFLDQ